MARKIYEVEYDDDLHMADAADNPGYKRGLLYDDDGNLKAHAKMREVDEDELRERYSEQDAYSYEHDYSSIYDDEDDDDEYEPLLSEEDIELLAAIGTLLGSFAVAVAKAAAPHVKSWWENTALPGLRDAAGNVAEFFTGDERHKEPKLEVSRETALRLAYATVDIEPTDLRDELSNAYEEYRTNMTSAEAQKTLMEIVVLSTMLAERISRLSNAHIDDDRLSGNYLEWQSTVAALTSDELIDGVNRILSGDVRVLDATQLASLELVLGRSVYEDGKYIPIEAQDLRDKLMPGQPDGPDDDGDDPLVIA